MTFLTLALGLVAATAAPQAAPSPAAPPPSAEKTIVGEIVTLDQARGKLVVQESRTVRVKGEEPKKENIELSVDASTSILIGRSPAALSELRAKDHVVVRYVVTSRGSRATSLRVAERKAGPTAPAAPSTPSTTTPAPTAPATGS